MTMAIQAMAFYIYFFPNDVAVFCENRHEHACSITLMDQ